MTAGSIHAAELSAPELTGRSTGRYVRAGWLLSILSGVAMIAGCRSAVLPGPTPTSQCLVRKVLVADNRGVSEPLSFADVSSDPVPALVAASANPPGDARLSEAEAIRIASTAGPGDQSAYSLLGAVRTTLRAAGGGDNMMKGSPNGSVSIAATDPVWLVSLRSAAAVSCRHYGSTADHS
ncbi:MAG: hypothetical protein NVSMB17_18480 [Candidatus Dormibacteria bacterium]